MEIASAFQRRGLLFVLSSPSGAGKSTIARMLLENDDGDELADSAFQVAVAAWSLSRRLRLQMGSRKRNPSAASQS